MLEIKNALEPTVQIAIWMTSFSFPLLDVYRVGIHLSPFHFIKTHFIIHLMVDFIVIFPFKIFVINRDSVGLTMVWIHREEIKMKSMCIHF